MIVPSGVITAAAVSSQEVSKPRIMRFRCAKAPTGYRHGAGFALTLSACPLPFQFEPTYLRDAAKFPTSFEISARQSAWNGFRSAITTSVARRSLNGRAFSICTAVW
jgi:hypothetical protein